MKSDQRPSRSSFYALSTAKRFTDFDDSRRQNQPRSGKFSSRATPLKNSKENKRASTKGRVPAGWHNSPAPPFAPLSGYADGFRARLRWGSPCKTSGTFCIRAEHLGRIPLTAFAARLPAALSPIRHKCDAAKMENGFMPLRSTGSSLVGCPATRHCAKAIGFALSVALLPSRPDGRLAALSLNLCCGSRFYCRA